MNLSKLMKFGGSFFLFFIGIIIIALTVYNSNKDFEYFSKKLSNEILLLKKEQLRNTVFQVVSLINSIKENIQLEAQNKAKKDVYIAYNIVENIYKNFKNKYSNKEIEKLVVEALRNLRFGKDNYFFIVKLNGEVLLNSFIPSLEGKNLYRLKDNQGDFFIKRMTEVVKEKGEGFISYFWHKPLNKEKYFKKISFVKLFKPLDLYIGTGIYPNDLLKEAQKQLLKKIANIRFGEEGYIFINRFDGTALISNGKIITKNKKLLVLYLSLEMSQKSLYKKERL